MRKRRQAGNAFLELTLAGIAVFFLLLSVFEMARAAWTYHTLSHTVKEAVRLAVVHGENCDPDVGPHSCELQLSDLALHIQANGAGLTPSLLTLRLMAIQVFTGATLDDQTHTLASLSTNSSYWPTNGPGTTPLSPNRAKTFSEITIVGTYPFSSAMLLFWPGAGGVSIGTFNMVATSSERIQF